MYKEKIDSYIESKKEEMLEDLKILVRINSQKGPAEKGKPFGAGPAEVLSAAEKLMGRYGLSVRNYENYVVTGDLPVYPNTDTASDDQTGEQSGCCEDPLRGEPAKGLDILAHLDVVPVTKDWKVTAPFEPKIVGGRIYGRGTADDKGPAIAALYALRAIRELGIPMKKSVRLILGSDEECGSSDLAYYYGIESEAPYSFTPDADFPVINIEKGRLEAHFEAEFTEASKDAARADRDEDKCGNTREGLEKAGIDGKTEENTIAGCLPRVRSLQSGDKANVVPGRAVLVLEGLKEDIVRTAALEIEKETGVSFDFFWISEDEIDGKTVEDEEQKCKGQNDGNKMTEDKSLALLKIEVRGQAAHASTPQEGKNALTAALRLITKLPLAKSKGLDALLALEHLMPYEDTCGKNLGIYREEERSGAVTLCFSILDYTPNRLRGTFDARLPIGCTDENTKQPIMRQLAGYDIQMEDTPMVLPHCVPGDSDFVRILLDSYERYSGKKGEPLSTGGGTYVHELERGVAFGCMVPEVDNHMHGDDEFMEIDMLVMSAKIFADAVVRICNEL